MANPQRVLARIFAVTGTPSYGDFNFGHIRNITPKKDDKGWGMPRLHDIHPELKSHSRPPKELLGTGLTDYFRQLDIPA